MNNFKHFQYNINILKDITTKNVNKGHQLKKIK